MGTYITGDIHGNVNRIVRFSQRFQLTKDDIIVILGDAGLNFFLDNRDYWKKLKISNIDPTILCVHGNHEERPYNVPGYTEQEALGGIVYAQKQFPNLLFAKDGEVYKLPSQDGTNHDVLVIGGAYSVDKPYRIAAGSPWFESEQPNIVVKQIVEDKIQKLGFCIDDVFSHTIPERFIPTEEFIGGIDQSSVDRSTETWLQEIYDKLNIKYNWYCGHWHCDKSVDNIEILYTSFLEL